MPHASNAQPIQLGYDSYTGERTYDTQFLCLTCDECMSRYDALHHICPPLPPGLVYVRFAGRARKYCTLCDEIVERRVKRHCERRH